MIKAVFKIIFCLSLFFAVQTNYIAAQSAAVPTGAFPAPDGLVLKRTMEVPMSLTKERKNTLLLLNVATGREA